MMKQKVINLLLIFIVFSYASPLNAQDNAEVAIEEEERVYEYAEANHQCFRCHGHKAYIYFNENLGRDIKERMNPYFVIDSVEYYTSNHWNFGCTDCHSYEYESFPHAGALRMEEKPNCLLCHGGDETYADYQFEMIEEEFAKSVHNTKHNEDFTCWMCHNPHSYKINARTNQNVLLTIQYDNAICLSCHANIEKYQLFSDLTNPNLIERHDWLPNQGLHFQNVRCIECHAEMKEDILISHNVQPKEKAVKLCVECHSSNSILMASLYKFQAKEQRNKLGFFNAAVLNNSYIIGANRNIYLNIISLVIFGLVFSAIAFHAFLRKVKK
jgi:hypothetical protein